MASYPSAIKSFTTKVDNVTDVLAAHINDLQDEVVAIETEISINVKKMLCKAWVKFDGSGTPAVTNSFNFDSSITDHGTGMWTLTLTTDFSTAHWAIAGMRRNPTATNAGFLSVSDAAAMTAGAIRIDSINYAGTYQDSTENYLICMGNQ